MPEIVPSVYSSALPASRSAIFYKKKIKKTTEPCKACQREHALTLHLLKARMFGKFWEGKLNQWEFTAGGFANPEAVIEFGAAEDRIRLKDFANSVKWITPRLIPGLTPVYLCIGAHTVCAEFA